MLPRRPIGDHPETSIEEKDTMTNGGERSFILKTYAREGPWALLAVLLIAVSGWIAWFFLNEYVRQNSLAVERIADSQSHIVEFSRSNQEFMQQNNQLIRQNAQLITAANNSIGLLRDLMIEAKTTMAPVVEERRRQTQLLEQINKQLDELNNKPTSP